MNDKKETTDQQQQFKTKSEIEKIKEDFLNTKITEPQKLADIKAKHQIQTIKISGDGLIKKLAESNKLLRIENEELKKLLDKHGITYKKPVVNEQENDNATENTESEKDKQN
jgi:transposase